MRLALGENVDFGVEMGGSRLLQPDPQVDVPAFRTLRLKMLQLGVSPPKKRHRYGRGCLWQNTALPKNETQERNGGN